MWIYVMSESQDIINSASEQQGNCESFSQNYIMLPSLTSCEQCKLIEIIWYVQTWDDHNDQVTAKAGFNV